uniref:Transcription factor IIIC 90kDa subunit N-terminal domain-containing protein n=1 Tax=Romanomermis culicivorax TaxID=13658 RepID=A0A915KPZ7_ROMCU
MEKTAFKRTFEADFETINSVGAIHWIGNEEILLIFQGFAAILRVDPFCDVIDLKFPYDISHIEFKSYCKPSIVPFIARSLNLQFFDSSMYRSRCKPENWHICNEIFTDSILITKQKYDDRAPIRISDFSCQNNELVIFVAHDGQPLLFRKFDVKFQFKENLTDKILEYLKFDSLLLKNLQSKSISDEKYLNEAWNFLSVARFVAVQSWHFAKFKNQIVGFSVQKDDSMVVWCWKNGDMTISNVYQFFENERISCLCVYIDPSASSNFIIFGSVKGNLYVAKIVIKKTESIAIENPRLIKSKECIHTQYCRQPNELTVIFGGLNGIWREIMAKDSQNAMMGSFDNSLDYLLCIRQTILNVDSDIPLYIAEFVDTLRNPETVSLYHLKVGRFILRHMKTRMFHCNASEEESNKVEILLIGVEKMLIKYRAGILMNSSCSSVVVDQAKQIFDAISNEDITLNLNQPCPFCGTKGMLLNLHILLHLRHFDFSLRFDIVDQTFDTTTLCCRSLLIIDDFSYDKCSRCGLPSKKNCPVEDLKSEAFRCCSMCDGKITSSDL